MDSILEQRGIESFLPLIDREREWADRKKRVAFPLFPGYIFACFLLNRLDEVLRTPGLATVVQMAGYPTPVRQSEIDSIQALVAGAKETGILPHPSDYLAPGQDVRVVEGPFEGLEGILVEARGRTRVVVRLNAIRQAASVEIDRRCLRAIET